MRPAAETLGSVALRELCRLGVPNLRDGFETSRPRAPFWDHLECARENLGVEKFRCGSEPVGGGARRRWVVVCGSIGLSALGASSNLGGVTRWSIPRKLARKSIRCGFLFRAFEPDER